MKKIISEDLKPLLAYITVCILWGTTYIAIKIAVKKLPPELSAGLRFLLSGLLVFLFAYYKKLKKPKDIKEIANISLLGFFLLTACNGGVMYAMKTVDSGFASVMLATSPIFIAIIEIIIYRKSIVGVFGYVGLILSFTGVIALVMSISEIGNFDIKGFTLLVIATLSLAIGSVYSGKLKINCSVIYSIAIQMIAGGIGLLTVSFLIGEWKNIEIDKNGFYAMIYLTIFGSIIGYGCYVYLLQKWPATKAGTYTYANTVIAVIIGVVFLKEEINTYSIISIFFVILGIIMVQISKQNKMLKPKEL